MSSPSDALRAPLPSEIARLHEFNPHSLNATLARIIANQEEAARKADAILVQVVKTNGRVTALETWREVITAKMVLLSGGVAGVISLGAWLLGFLR